MGKASTFSPLGMMLAVNVFCRCSFIKLKKVPSILSVLNAFMMIRFWIILVKCFVWAGDNDVVLSVNSVKMVYPCWFIFIKLNHPYVPKIRFTFPVVKIIFIVVAEKLTFSCLF